LVRSLVLLLLLTFGGTLQAHAQTGQDPLPSWNEGAVKQSILAFVTRVTTFGGPEFVPVADRIAVFDNDGTLWAEKPVPNEVYFVLARVRQLAERDPSVKNRQPFKAALEGDSAYFHKAGAKAVLDLLVGTHSRMTQEQFAQQVQAWLTTATHPHLKRPITATAYQPMLELLTHLRANGFQTWICSGGTADFMRQFASRTYGIPPQQVIGSQFKRESRVQAGRREIWRLPTVDSFNDKAEKPVNIDRQIGKRPLFVGGNVLSGGDIAMMEYSKGRTGPSFQLLVNHDDTAREFAYAEKDNASLNAASQQGFTVVSIARDWKSVFVERGAGSLAPGTPGAPSGLEDRDWILTEVDGQPVTVPQDQRAPYLRLTAEGKRLQGYGGVNQFSASYERGALTLTFSPIAATRRAGPPESMRLEAALMQALGATTGYRISGQALDLLAGDRIVARFRAVAPM
jgi:heat shock protein HslJ/phosphoglycolate phosphatase-like HAD superfamily hydrolase